MTKLTIVYTDGYQEHYSMMSPKTPATAETVQKRLEEILKDGIIRIILHDEQLVIIPLANVRKIIHSTDEEELKKLKVKEYTAFLSCKFIDSE